MLEELKNEFGTIEDWHKLSWLYEQDDKYSMMSKYATEDDEDEFMEISSRIFQEILKLK